LNLIAAAQAAVI